MDKKKISAKTLRTIIIVCTCVFGAAAIFCGVKYAYAQKQYSDSRKNFEAMAEEYVNVKEIETGTEIPTINSSSKKEEKESPIDVDFNILCGQAARGDVVGWLYCPDTVINYPVTQCDDNSFYLEHQLDGKPNACGNLFVDCRCQSKFSGRNTIIYGHHMADGAMFNCLKNYRNNPDFFAEHPVMYLNTPEGNYEMAIFSTFHCETQTPAFQVDFANDAEFEEYLNFIRDSSVMDAITV